MIHRESRDKLALALRQYVSGRISNDDLEDVYVDWRDRGAVNVQDMAWNLYNDTYNHYAKGKHKINKELRHEIARWIVFLHSDLEYIWPEYSFMQIYNWPMNLITFGWWERMKKRKFEQFLKAGDFDVWPFVKNDDFQKAIQSPRLL